MQEDERRLSSSCSILIRIYRNSLNKRRCKFQLRPNAKRAELIHKLSPL
jgi:hypothetical protein